MWYDESMEKTAPFFSDMYIGSTMVQSVDCGTMTFQEASDHVDLVKSNYSLFSDVFKNNGVTRITLRWMYDADTFIFDSWTPEGLDNE